MYAEGSLVSVETVEEIVEKLSEKNYITPWCGQQYCEVLMEEFRRYVASRDHNTMR